MQELLNSNVCEVVFTKVDGSERTMKATLKPDYIAVMNKPDEHELPKKPKAPKKPKEPTKPKKPKKVAENVISCYDVEKSGWRSFRIDNVKSFRVI